MDTKTEHLKVKHYGQCPHCGDYSSTEIWDTDRNSTIFCCCDCEIMFDVVDSHAEYTHHLREDYADWYYVCCIETFEDFGSVPHNCCGKSEATDG